MSNENSFTPEVRALYAAIGRGEILESRVSRNGSWDEWGGYRTFAAGAPEFEWRIKPRTLTFTVTIPEPLRVEPINGAMVYGVGCGDYFEFTYESKSPKCAAAFKNGHLYATRLEAAEAAKAFRIQMGAK